jgi:hypothetical protein
MNAHHRRLVGPLFVRQAYAVLLALTTSFTGRIEPLQAAEIYRSVDAEGHVVYSDHLDDSVAQTPVQINDPNLFSDDEARSSEAPPPLLDDPLPPCPEDGDLWTPGYWSRNAGGFFWVPGDWFPPPRIGLLWTPGFWQYVDAVYIFHRGYWAPHVGYYGGVNYGSGYFGTAFTGGRWVGRSFAYNLAVYGANARIFHDTYTESVPTRSDHDRVSFNGGPGGITRVITADEKAWATETHIHPTPLQRRTLAHAAATPTLLAQPAHLVIPQATHVAQSAAVNVRPAPLTAPRVMSMSAAHTAAPATVQREVVRAASSPRVMPQAATPRSAAPARLPAHPPS